MQRRDALRVVLTGTSDARPSGGIAVAMAGWRAALEAGGMFEAHEPIHDAHARGGRWWPAMRGLPRVVRRVRAITQRGEVAGVFGHGGGPVSIQREVVVLGAARAAGARTLLQLHSRTLLDVVSTAPGRGWLRGALAVPHRVSVSTPYWADVLREAGWRGPVSVIPNPLPPDALDAARAGPRPERPSRDLWVLVMTRLVPDKNVACVLEAVAALDGAVVTVAGDGPDRPRLEALVRDLGLGDRAVFVGWVSGDAKARLLEQADVYCLPTTGDAFGMGFVEAMARGVPVVAARWGPTPDVVPDGVAGTLVAEVRADLVAQALSAMREPAVRHRMGEAARRHVLEAFAPAVLAPRIADAFY